MPYREKYHTPIRKILIALDYEQSATKVATEGYALAHAMGAEIVLLHVINDPVFYSSLEYSPIMGYSGLETSRDTEVITEKDLKQASDFFLEKIRSHLGENVMADTITEEGDFPEAILHVAERIKADLIVMGSHSRRGIEKLLIGSITEKVVNNSKIPLYIIPVKETD